MNFIDIFDFKKYFKRPGDGNRAKIGHVNAVIEELGKASSGIKVLKDDNITMADLNKVLVYDYNTNKAVLPSVIPSETQTGQWSLTINGTPNLPRQRTFDLHLDRNPINGEYLTIKVTDNDGNSSILFNFVDTYGGANDVEIGASLFITINNIAAALLTYGYTSVQNTPGVLTITSKIYGTIPDWIVTSVGITAYFKFIPDLYYDGDFLLFNALFNDNIDGIENINDTGTPLYTLFLQNLSYTGNAQLVNYYDYTAAVTVQVYLITTIEDYILFLEAYLNNILLSTGSLHTGYYSDYFSVSVSGSTITLTENVLYPASSVNFYIKSVEFGLIYKSVIDIVHYYNEQNYIVYNNILGSLIGIDGEYAIIDNNALSYVKLSDPETKIESGILGVTDGGYVMPLDDIDTEGILLLYKVLGKPNEEGILLVERINILITK